MKEKLTNELLAGIATVIQACVSYNIRKATYYYSPKMVVKSTRRHKGRSNERTVECVVTVGGPNFAERKYIESRLKTGKPFGDFETQTKKWK